MCGSFLLYIWELFVESVNRHVNLRRFCFPGSQAAGIRQCFWLNASFESSLLPKSSLFAPSRTVSSPFLVPGNLNFHS